MECQTAINYLEDYLDDLLDTVSRECVQGHLEGCPACRKRLAREQFLREALESQPEPAADPDFATRVFTRAARKYRRRKFTSSIMRLAACVLIFLALGLVYKGVLETGQSKGPEVAVVMNKPEEVRLVFFSAENHSDVTFTLELPSGIDIIGHEGQREITWQGNLDKGSNLLVLPVIVRSPDSNYMVAGISHGKLKRNFKLSFNVQKPGAENSNPGRIESDALSTRSI